jgi:Fe-S-cluster-containing dehydrogenase component
MTKAFLVDLARCVGCHNCQVACKDEFCGQPWLPYSEAQPETGSFWMRVDEYERGQVPVVRVAYTPMLCNHCDAAPCAEVCPSGAFARRDDGLLLIDPAACTGCKACVDACPTHAIYFNDEKGVAQKCTGCAHLLDDGWTVPRCVDVCSTEALTFGEEDELDLEGARPLDQTAGFGAHVYYKHPYKRFVAGCVYDPKRGDVVIGATVTLSTPEGEAVAVQETDEFGDWKFDHIEPAGYHISVNADGYQPIELDADVTEKDLFTGDRPMVSA